MVVRNRSGFGEGAIPQDHLVGEAVIVQNMPERRLYLGRIASIDTEGVRTEPHTDSMTGKALGDPQHISWEQMNGEHPEIAIFHHR